MKDHSVYVVTWTKRESIGSWITHPDSDRGWYHHSWGNPVENKTYYLASSEKLVLAHWSDWAKTTSSETPAFVRCEKLGDAVVILEMK